jgi:hypothetical protein
LASANASDGGTTTPSNLPNIGQSFEVDKDGMFIKKKRRKKKTNVFVLFLKIVALILMSPWRLLMIVVMRSDPPNILKCKKGQKASLAKCVAMSEPIDLDRIKVVGRAINGTVNDVVVAVTGLAVRNYMLEQFNGDESKVRRRCPENPPDQF